MTPAEAASRLSAAERGARSYGDATYTSAVDLADPGDVRAADDEVSAEELQREFLELAEGMQELDTDAATIGDAIDMVIAEAEVADAARAVKQAEAALADAEQCLAHAQARAAAATEDGQASADAAVAEAGEAVTAARAALAAAKRRLAEALAVAADLAASMREGLHRRHGGIQEAVDSAPVQPADRDFYQPGGN